MKVADFVKEVVALKKVAKGVSLFFRGENAPYTNPCTPAIYRDDFHIDRERFFFNEALHRFPEKFSKCETDLDRLVYMQHYGIPTRLLDVTENPLVALFFACESAASGKEKEAKDGCVFCISVPFGDVHYGKNKNVKKLVSLVEKGRGFSTKDNDYEKIVFVKPSWIDERIKRQQGGMLLFGCGGQKKDRLELKEARDGCSVGVYIKQKWSIPANDKSEIRRELCALGVQKSFLFPDLGNLAKEIEWRFQCHKK